MSIPFDYPETLATIPRFTARGIVWTGRRFKRLYKNATNGVCLLCNNLQPEGHENTITWIPSSSKRYIFPGVDGKGTDVPALSLEGLSPKELRKCLINSKTGISERDCKYCRFLCQLFDAFFIDEYRSWIVETASREPKFGLIIRQGAPLVVTTNGFAWDRYLQFARADIEVYVDPAAIPDTIPGLPSTGPAADRQTDTRSEICINLIKDTVSQCCREHIRCQVPSQGFKPTRLLYVGEGDDALRLCETNTWKDTVQYLALSHCWGGSKPLSLTQSCLNAFKQRIDFSILPITFKDAIAVARILQLSYIWIDSLCIIQDNTPDWEKEAAQMADVYSQAFVVVTTASSPNPETPILGPRKDEWLAKRFDFPLSPGVVYPIMARKRHILAAPLKQGLLDPPFTSAWATLKRIGPLYDRGWCFQESYLATRNLQFTPGGIVFECKTHRRSEDQLPPYPSTVLGSVIEPDPAEKWRMIVKSFTSRQLTFGTDKLPAISGAASTMAQVQTSRYLAGLWYDTLLFDLLWQVMPWMTVAGCEEVSLAYEDEEGGPPTWSWASMNWGINWSPSWFVNGVKLAATVLDAQTVVEGINPYGKVSSGVIRLKGRLRRCQLKWNTHKGDFDAFYMQDNGTKCKSQYYRTDGPLSYEKEAGPYGALVRRGRKGPFSRDFETTAAVFLVAYTPSFLLVGRVYAGLVLGTSPRHPGCMERVGAIFGLPDYWYDSAEEAEVVIV